MKINPTGSRRLLMRRASGDSPWVRDQQRPRSRPHMVAGAVLNAFTVMPLECHRDQGQRRRIQVDPASGVPGQLLRPGTPTVSPH